MEAISEVQKNTLSKLDEMGISYEIDRHEAVYTIEAMVELGLDKKGEVVKNLFLRDAKGKRHFLVVLPGGKQADLKEIRDQLGTSALSFASEDRLARYLKLGKGAVSPLGVLNDSDQSVEVVFEKGLVGQKKLGIHPNDNTATVWVSWDSLKKIVDSCGNTVHFIKL